MTDLFDFEKEELDERFKVEKILDWKKISFLSDAVFWHRLEQERQLKKGPQPEEIPFIKERLAAMEEIEDFLEPFKQQFILGHIRLTMEK